MKFNTMRYALLVMMLTLFLSDTTLCSTDELLGKFIYKVITMEERLDNLETQFQSAFDGLNARLDKMTEGKPSMNSEVSDMKETITTTVAKIVQSQYTVLRNFVKEEKKVLSETKHHLQANVTNLNTVIEHALLIYNEQSESQEKLLARNVREMRSGFDEVLKQSALQTGTELDKQDRKIQELSKRTFDIESQATSQGHQLSEHSNQLRTSQRNVRIYKSLCRSVSDRVNSLEKKANDVESQVTSHGHQLSEHSNQLYTTQRNLRVYQSSCSSVGDRVDALENKTGSFVSFSTVLTSHLPDTPIGMIIKFDYVINNYGNHYSTSTGKFTAPVSGIYVFIVYIASDGNKTAHVGLYVDETIKTTAISDSTRIEQNETGGNSVIVQLVQGQEVYIKTFTWPDKHDIFASWKTTFSGALLYAD